MRLTTLVLAFSLFTPAAARADLPVPEQDAFYRVPKRVAHLPNGTVLGSRPVSTDAFGSALPATAYQVKYRTLDNHGRPTATVTTVLIPDAAWGGAGRRPLVSYQTAEDGVSGQCAPSYVLRNGFSSAANNTAPEAFVMEQALQQGIAVVVPDYEGPRSEFLSGLGEGRMVIDGIRAARRFGPAGLHGSPAAIWGYSGGAYATSIAGQIQPAYAPRVRLAAMVLGGVPADLQSTILSFDRLRLGGILAMGFSSVARAYPRQHLEQYLNATGRAALEEASHDCIADAALRRIGQGFSDFESTPDAIHLPAVTRFLRRISPLGIPGTPATPVYDYHAVLDELAPIGPDRELVARYCAAGVRVSHLEDRLSEHLSLVASAAPGVVRYLTDRFNGVPAPSTC